MERITIDAINQGRLNLPYQHMDCKVKTLEVRDGSFFDLRILDTTYHEKIENNGEIHTCDLVIYVFDVTKYDTFEKL